MEAYPLQWPLGWKRTQTPLNSKFKGQTVHTATKILMAEFGRLNAKKVVLSTNIILRNDGYPHSRLRPPEDKGVAVYFDLKGVQHVMACDKWKSIEDNIYAIAKHIDALRGQDRWGVGSLEQAFSGFKALPASFIVEKSWYEVFGFEQGITIITRELINDRYRNLTMQYHPDKPGGLEERMSELNQARDKALKHCL